MSRLVAAAYDERAPEYASLFLDEVERDPVAVGWLRRFIELAHQHAGPVVDVGCGPGGVVQHLVERSLPTIGLDISAGQLAQAREAFSSMTSCVADLSQLPIRNASLAGIVSRYSIIHVAPAQLGAAFADWARVLKPEAPALISFFAAIEESDHGIPFDHAVVEAYALFPSIVERLLAGAGFDVVATEIRPPRPGGRPFEHATLLVHRVGG